MLFKKFSFKETNDIKPIEKNVDWNKGLEMLREARFIKEDSTKTTFQRLGNIMVFYEKVKSDISIPIQIIDEIYVIYREISDEMDEYMRNN